MNVRLASVGARREVPFAFINGLREVNGVRPLVKGLVGV